MKPPLFDPAEVRTTLSVLVAPGSVFELRALDAHLNGCYRSRAGRVSGYFDSIEACISELNRLDAFCGAYVTLNPVDPALLARRANRLDYVVERDALTGDQHIEKRHWLPLDVDPKRPSGISATDQQKEAAEKKASQIDDYLTARGWPPALKADSGNGYHLVYRVDLPRDDEEVVKKVIGLLADRFDDDVVELDRAVYNPSRIVRLYGTLAAKGDDTPDRPHRLSKIMRQAGPTEALRADQLKALISDLAPDKPKPSGPSDEAGQDSTAKASFDVEAFFARHGIEVTEKVNRADGSIMWLLKQCPFNPDHTATSVAVFQAPDGKLGFNCKHSSCSDKHWKDFRGHFEPESIPERLNSPLPKVQLPGDNRLLSAFATEIAKDLKGCGIYRRGGFAMIVNEQRDGLEIITPAMLRSLVEKHLVCFRIRGSGQKLIEMAHTMSSDDAQGVLSAAQFLSRLPKVARIATARLPVMRAGGVIDLLPAGYDRQTLTLTLPQCDYDATMPVPVARQLIDGLLAEFPFADTGRSKSVAVSGMVGLYVIVLLDPKSLRPVFIYLANAEGAGKTLLAKCAISPTHGLTKIDGDLKDRIETRKEILAAVIEARPYILFDNCKRHIDSSALESLASAVIYKGRILGLSKSFEGANLMTVFITGNGATVSPDMRRRSLFVQLFMNLERAEDRVFRRILDDAALFDMRPKILAALWAFVREWDRAGRPGPSRTHSAFPRWAQIVGGIVEHAGYSCPLETAEIPAAADVDGSDMRELIRLLNIDERLKFDDLVEIARTNGLFERIVGSGSDGDLKPSEKNVFGKLLKRYDRRIFSDCRVFVIDGKGHSRTFRVVVKP